MQPIHRVPQPVFLVKRRNCDAHPHDIVPSDSGTLTTVSHASSVSLDSSVTAENDISVSRFKDIWGCLMVIVAVLILYSFLPLGSAIQFGGDEGYELMKGFLVSKGFKLYQAIWSDQPPVFSVLLGCAFKLWGPSMLTARLIAAGFGLLLFGTFFQLVYLRIGRRAAFLATFFLLASPAILEISVSVMQEVPAFGTALAATLFLFRWRKHRHWAWLIASGAVMGIALGIKLTAILIAPAMLVEIALASQSDQKRLWLKPAVLSAVQWTGSVVIIFGIVNFLWGRGSAESSWKAHFSEHTAFGSQTPEDFPMPVSVFLDHSECVGAAIVGLISIAHRRRWREFAFPLTILGTALGIHFVHRPWWMYYYLHIAIPMAWLAGFAVNETVARLSVLFAKIQLNRLSKKTWQGIGLSALIALVLVRSEGRLESGLKDLSERGRIKNSLVLAKMREYTDQSHWAYAQFGDEAYPFNARLPMPPELAVVTLKRFWSGQITVEKIVEICQRYQVEELLLDSSRINYEWDALLNDYDIVYKDKMFTLYVARRIRPK